MEQIGTFRLPIVTLQLGESGKGWHRKHWKFGSGVMMLRSHGMTFDDMKSRVYVLTQLPDTIHPGGGCCRAITLVFELLPPIWKN